MGNFKYLNLIERNKKKEEITNYLKDDFCIYEISYHPPLEYPFKTNEYSCYICLEGESRGTIDLSSFCLRPSFLAVNTPGQLVELYSMSKDFRAIGITMSREFISNLGLPYSFHLDRMLRTTPILELKESILQSMLSYCSMVQRLLAAERPYQTETLRHLTCAFFYGFKSYFQTPGSKPLSNEELIMKQFIVEVKEHFHTQRKVLFYSDRLNISACYLSTVIKNVSGKSPTEWINDFIIKEAYALLKTTNLTIQQISIELGFPSQSFFGKFFKRITGFSPTDYRDSQTPHLTRQ
ncbi:MAG: helix-turn-helix domain-containing protein [Prevotellaceae bacterium]|nr:helix-turn-helix domain-containing protein [Prevotellaceae bacterium]